MTDLPPPQEGVEFRPVKRWPGYAVGTDGSVWSSRPHNGRDGDWRRLKQMPDKDGYRKVVLCVGKKLKRVSVHTIVLLAFVGPQPKGLQCRHLDGNHANNVPGNLCWGTGSQNAQDSILHGTRPRGERNGQAKMTEAQARQALADVDAGVPQAEVARRLGVTRNAINLLANNKSWKHLRKDGAP